VRGCVTMFSSIEFDPSRQVDASALMALLS